MRYKLFPHWKGGVPAWGMHVSRFLFRLCVFLGVLICYLLAPQRLDLSRPWREIGLIAPGHILCVILLVTMSLLHLREPGMSMGRLKQYSRYARLDPQCDPDALRSAMRRKNLGALKVLAVWLAGNAVVAVLYFRGRIGVAELVLLCAFYYLSDIICILFFCPFQSWMMHNRCCTTCRIYNWDYAMMCTPLLGVAGLLSLSACLLAAAVLVRWEFTYLRHQERFFVSSNDALRCDQCHEHLCRYKRALSLQLPQRRRGNRPIP